MTLNIVSLTDSSTGSLARIVPAFGFNCYQFQVQHQGRPVEILWSAPGFETGHERASGSGIPLLFPFPGRIPGTTFRWQGRQFSLTEGDNRGNAIHGFVLNRPWRVLDQDEQRVIGQFQASVDAPELLAQWPSDFCLTATYELSGNTLRSRFVASNPGTEPLPCGFGTHPYFRLPLGGTSADTCRVRLPVTRKWELVDMLPTGRQLELPDAAALQAGVPFGGMKYDDVMAGLKFERGECRAEIHDQESQLRLELRFDTAFRECVVYTPPHREAICIEPYTCCPGAFGLQDQGMDAGLRILGPGQSFDARVDMAVVAAS